MKTNRTFLAVTVAIAALVALAAPAQAAPPQAQPGQVQLDSSDAAGNGYCSFPVLIDYVSNQRLVETTGPGGERVQHITGYAFATVTNVSTDESLRYNISGPGTVTIFPDGSFTIDASGANLLWTTVANSYPGVPQLAYTTGHVQVSVDASGLTTSYTLSGSSTNVCAALS